MSEEPIKYGKNATVYRVVPWVRDCDLEHVLNDFAQRGFEITEIFRNLPGADRLETTTIVFKNMF